MLNSIKSKLILKNIFKIIGKKAYLDILKYNKNIQSKLGLSLESYHEYYNQIEIEIIPVKSNSENKIEFINNININYKVYFKSSFDTEERNYFYEKENLSKISILITNKEETSSLFGLFQNCQCLKEVKIIHCSKNYLTNIAEMFIGCKSLISVDISRLKADNINDMSFLFAMCPSLKLIQLPKINGDNLVNMEHMFAYCSNLEKIDLSNLKTDKVTNMKGLFTGCTSLPEKKLPSFAKWK